MDIARLCTDMDDRNASDLFICAGKPPAFRVLGRVQPEGDAPISAADIDAFLDAHLPGGVREQLTAERDMDVGLTLGDAGRFRLNLHYQKGRPAMAIRRVPSGALDARALNLPDVILELAARPRGLVLITGATGSGKSTTMAAMLHHINTTENRHIVTIEDPIEYVHQDRQCVVSQREVGTDTLTFANALRHVVRQNPDVIFIGEMRDRETIETAVSAAMTGHLVISTMHTVDVYQTLERIVNYFPDGRRDQVAQDLAMALEGIVSQRLLPRADTQGRVPVFEILVTTPLARRMIATRDLEEVTEIIKAGSDDGMITFARSLVQRCESGLVDTRTAADSATNREEFMLAAQGMETGIDTLRGRSEAQVQGLSMKKLLRDTLRYGASDLILSVGAPPTVRLDGTLRSFDMPPLSPSDTRALLFSLLSTAQRGTFEAQKEIDFALSVSDRFDLNPDPRHQGDYRFRVNGFFQKGCVGCAFRVIPQSLPSPESLRIPPAVMNLADKPQGLILVTGPTGHGKTTTLACLIDRINRRRACHIITIEDPIEFVHANRRSVIEQREVNADTKSFHAALKYVLRQDPDVILIGEMRDAETISAALTAAETGHLVLATLHTNDAVQTVDRIIDVFPADRQNQVRTQLAASLEAVVAQRLLPASDRELGRVAAFEIMLGTVPVRAQIRECRTHQLAGVIETAAKDGMVTMDRSLQELHNAGLIDEGTLRTHTRNPATAR